MKCGAGERRWRRLDGAEPLSAPVESRCKRVPFGVPEARYPYGCRATLHIWGNAAVFLWKHWDGYLLSLVECTMEKIDFQIMGCYNFQKIMREEGYSGQEETPSSGTVFVCVG